MKFITQECLLKTHLNEKNNSNILQVEILTKKEMKLKCGTVSAYIINIDGLCYVLDSYVNKYLKTLPKAFKEYSRNITWEAFYDAVILYQEVLNRTMGKFNEKFGTDIFIKIIFSGEELKHKLKLMPNQDFFKNHFKGHLAINEAVDGVLIGFLQEIVKNNTAMAENKFKDLDISDSNVIHDNFGREIYILINPDIEINYVYDRGMQKLKSMIIYMQMEIQVKGNAKESVEYASDILD